MGERIDITVQEPILALNPEKKARLAKVNRFEPTDRTPVIVNNAFWVVPKTQRATFEGDLIRLSGWRK